MISISITFVKARLKYNEEFIYFIILKAEIHAVSKGTPITWSSPVILEKTGLLTAFYF